MSTATSPSATTPESRREQRSWYFYDWANSAFATTVAGVLFSPYLVAVVELAEGTRLITNLVECTTGGLAIGMPLQLAWLDADPELTLPVFRPAPQEH